LADFANVDGLGREIASISQSGKMHKTLEEIQMSMPPIGDAMSQCRRSKPHYYITGTSNDTTLQLIL
jgi:hypothetical protein